VIELSMGAAIAMIAIALAGTLLVGAQRQERITDETGSGVDTARGALDRVVKAVRGARSLAMVDGDARAWVDANGDGVEDAGEVASYGFRPDGADQQLIRIVDGATQTLARGLDGGSLTVVMIENGPRLTMTIVVPGSDGRSGTTMRSEVSTRGNV
jgi:hypothetical protein